MAEQPKPKFIYNLKTLHEKTKSEIFVDWETTTDPESLEILQLLESRGLKRYCSMKSEHGKILDDLAIEFLTRATYKNNSFSTKVRNDGKKSRVEVTVDELGNMFGISTEGVDPFSYKIDEYLDSFKMMARSSHQETTKNMKRPMLRRKYRLLILILTKCILGEQQSHDGLTKPRIYCLRTTLDGVQVNWARLLFTRLYEEYKRFEKIKVSENLFKWTLKTVASMMNMNFNPGSEIG